MQKMLVPNLWPFGEGLLMTAVGAAADGVAGYYWIAACPDGYTQADGKPLQECWDKWREAEGPHLVLRLPTVGACDSMIRDIRAIKKELRKAELEASKGAQV